MADLEITVTPRASFDRVGPWQGGILRVRVTRPPADGRANRAVVHLVADALAVPASRVDVVAGAGARRKRLRIDGLDAAEMRRRLAAIGAD